MVKQLEWACKLGGTVSGDLHGGAVLARLMESQIWHCLLALWLHAGRIQKRDKGKGWPLPVFLSGRKLSPSSRLDARHFSSSLYATSAFQVSTLVLELTGNESV